MLRVHKKTDSADNKPEIRYIMLSKLLLILSVLFIIWISFVAIGIFILGLGPNWALLNLENWMTSWCILAVIFIILEIVFYFLHISEMGKGLKPKESKPEFLHGKQLYVYTHPADAEGGIFSKTYIPIDENTILRLRSLMVPSQKLWGKKEEK